MGPVARAAIALIVSLAVIVSGFSYGVARTSIVLVLALAVGGFVWAFVRIVRGN